MKESDKTVKILVSGQVQGVFFRQSAREKALDLGLRGTAQNLPDGKVLIFANGPSGAISHFVAWCHQGPIRAEVTAVEVTDLPHQYFDGFHILRW